MDLPELLRKGGMDGDVDFLREALRVLVEGIMDAEVSSRTGAEYGERSAERVTQRNGYRSRAWDTRVGTMDLHIPKLREGSYFPSLLEPRRRSERALLAVIQQAYVEGVCTRRVDDLVKALGCEGISKSQVSRICQELDVVVDGFMGRPLDGGPYPYLWLDALTQKVREAGRIVDVSVVVATAVNGEGKREIMRRLQEVYHRLLEAAQKQAQAMKLEPQNNGEAAQDELSEAKKRTERELEAAQAIRQAANTLKDQCQQMLAQAEASRAETIRVREQAQQILNQALNIKAEAESAKEITFKEMEEAQGISADAKAVQERAQKELEEAQAIRADVESFKKETSKLLGDATTVASWVTETKTSAPGAREVPRHEEEKRVEEPVSGTPSQELAEEAGELGLRVEEPEMLEQREDRGLEVAWSELSELSGGPEVGPSLEEAGTPEQGGGEESLETALSQLDQVSDETSMLQPTEQVASSQESSTTRESGEVDEILAQKLQEFLSEMEGSEQATPSTSTPPDLQVPEASQSVTPPQASPQAEESFSEREVRELQRALADLGSPDVPEQVKPAQEHQAPQPEPTVASQEQTLAQSEQPAPQPQPQPAAAPVEYSGEFSIVVTPRPDKSGIERMWTALEGVVGVGKVIASQPLRDGSGLEFTLDLGKEKLSTTQLTMAIPGSVVEPLDPDKLKLGLPSSW